MTASLPKTAGGDTKELDNSVTTMWNEPTVVCPWHSEHDISGSTSKYYCHECGLWWWRDGWGTNHNHF